MTNQPVAWQYVWPNGDCYTTTTEQAVRNYAIGAAKDLLPEQLGEVFALYRHPPTDLLKHAQKVLQNVSGVGPIGNDDDYCESAWAQHRSVLRAIEKWIGESNEQ